MTFYRDAAQLPPFEDYSMRGRSYRYFEGEALYPFGFGLSYTTFLDSDARYDEGGLSVTIRNAGGRAGEEVAQAYVKMAGRDAPTHPRLCGFLRLKLQPGEAKRVTIPLDRDCFLVVNDRGEKVDGGSATLFVGGSQPDPRSERLRPGDPADRGLVRRICRRLPSADCDDPCSCACSSRRATGRLQDFGGRQVLIEGPDITRSGWRRSPWAARCTPSATWRRRSTTP